MQGSPQRFLGVISESPCPLVGLSRRVSLTSGPLDLCSLVDRVCDPSRGAVVTFKGIVRDREEGRPIASITYEAYVPMVGRVLQELVKTTEARWPVRVSIAHRIGRVPVGELSLLVAVAGPHRKEAFLACEFVVDAIKWDAPIWKVRYEEERKVTP